MSNTYKLIGIVEKLTLDKPENIEKYGEGSWIMVSGVSIKANASPDKLPDVGQLAFFEFQKRGKLNLLVSWAWVDLPKSSSDTPLLTFDDLRYNRFVISNLSSPLSVSGMVRDIEKN